MSRKWLEIRGQSWGLYYFDGIPAIHVHRHWGNGGINSFNARPYIVNVSVSERQVPWWGGGKG